MEFGAVCVLINGCHACLLDLWCFISTWYIIIYFYQYLILIYTFSRHFSEEKNCAGHKTQAPLYTSNNWMVNFIMKTTITSYHFPKLQRKFRFDLMGLLPYQIKNFFTPTVHSSCLFTLFWNKSCCTLVLSP